MSALRQQYPGCYRVTLGGGRFAQLKRGRYHDSLKWGESFTDDAGGRWWRAEIRDEATGDLLCHAGIHKTRRAALQEVGADQP